MEHLINEDYTKEAIIARDLDKNRVDLYVKQVKEGLSYLKTELMNLNIEYNGGDAGNFIYINIHDADKARKIVDNLMDKKIYIRGRWPNPYDTGFSVTGAPMEIMDKFFNEFYQVYYSLIK